VSDDTLESVGASASVRSSAASSGRSADRVAAFAALSAEAASCTRCPQLVGGRTQVVFGVGNPDAQLMFVGEAPGAREDELGVPFVGAPGKLLDELLGSVGLDRDSVFITTVLKCHPPGNRDPSPTEMTRCQPYLHEQIALIRPRVVCTLGSVATRLVRGHGDPIKHVHGRVEAMVIGTRAVYVLPLLHPAAALYTGTLLETLRADIARLPELLARPELPQPEPESEPVAADDPGPSQLGLF
jgi:uracil-DNA glycosylase family 4